ncbi:MAG: oligosaccharide flippase family protein [Pseudomonadota bacterium]
MVSDAGTASNAQPGGSALGGVIRQIAGQTAMLFSGFATAQVCAFLRNAIFAHALSRGDFGIAATILLTMQLLETLAELGSEKLIVQADDGASRAVVGTAQSFLLIRGVVTAAMLLAAAHPLAAFFKIPEAAPAFMAVALAPLMRGFLNLDMQRAQRALNNRPYVMVEVLPQILALVVTPLALWFEPSFAAVVIVAVVQAGAALLVSHCAASERIDATWDPAVARRMFAFAWPIWLSALPVVAVYHADRILIGRLIDMEAVAGYSAAFLITMVPGMIVGKVGNAVLLPLLANVKHEREVFTARLQMMLVAVSLLAALYAIAFALIGGPVLTLAFGAAYSDLHLVVALLALSWAVRMLQLVPGLALLAVGRTQALLLTGCVRACGLLPAYWAIAGGYGIAGVAAVAVLAECAALGFISWRTRRLLRSAPSSALATA